MSQTPDAAEQIDPYRIFFPLGMFAGFLALALWFFFLFRWTAFYPRLSHGNLFFFGFFWSFVAGFLMTAIPKMTSTKPPNHFEVFGGVFLVFCQIAISLRSAETLAVGLFLLQQILLIQFLVRRFFLFRKFPFPGMIFLPLGFLSSLLGIGWFFLTEQRDLFILFAGEAFLANLILGLGSRLIPVISRLPGALTPAESGGKESPLWPYVCAVLINVGYLLEFSILPVIPEVVRILGFSVAIVVLLKLFSMPTRWTTVGVGFKISLLLFLMGQILAVVFPDYYLSMIHLTYLGGFFLVTVLVSVRVMLAHGSQPLSYEVSSIRVASIVGLVVVASILRLFVRAENQNLPIYISLIFVLISMLLWAHKFYYCLLGQKHANQC